MFWQAEKNQLVSPSHLGHSKKSGINSELPRLPVYMRFAFGGNLADELGQYTASWQRESL